jgi:hypothetical protein
MDVLSAVINARFALEYWMRETAVNARDKRWAEHGRRRSCLECETLQWIEDHLRAKLDTPPMKDEATPEQLAMARRVADELIPNPENESVVYKGFHRTAERAALAAIIETQRLDAGLADSMTLEMPGISIGLADGASLARRQIATAIRAGKHYEQDQQ